MEAYMTLGTYYRIKCLHCGVIKPGSEIIDRVQVCSTCYGNHALLRAHLAVLEAYAAHYRIPVIRLVHMYAVQGGKCGLCSLPFSAPEAIRVHYDSLVRRVRALWCDRCDVACGVHGGV